MASWIVMLLAGNQGAEVNMGELDSVRRAYSFWGRHPGFYAAQDYFTFLGRPKRVRRRAVEALGVGRGAKVLEVGCGTGRNFPFLLERIGPEGELVGFDYSSAMLGAAGAGCRARGHVNVRLVQGDAAELSDVGSGFDAVLSVLAVSAIPGWEAALGRCFEVLRPGGVLVVCDGRLFGGALSVLNPAVRGVYARFAAWRPGRDIAGRMRELFGHVAEESLNLGTFFVARARKPEAA
ncbi:MAG: class I SAM-dependent methyltransferase [Myxococcaceae bacterium]